MIMALLQKVESLPEPLRAIGRAALIALRMNYSWNTRFSLHGGGELRIFTTAEAVDGFRYRIDSTMTLFDGRRETFQTVIPAWRLFGFRRDYQKTLGIRTSEVTGAAAS